MESLPDEDTGGYQEPKYLFYPFMCPFPTAPFQLAPTHPEDPAYQQQVKVARKVYRMECISGMPLINMQGDVDLSGNWGTNIH